MLVCTAIRSPALVHSCIGHSSDGNHASEIVPMSIDLLPAASPKHTPQVPACLWRQQQTLVYFLNPQGVMSSFAEDSALSLEVRYWTSAAYMEMLNAAAPMGVDPKEWKLPPDPLFTAPVATAANSLGLASLFQCLVEDSMQKQIALEHVQCGADGATQRCEISAWRLRDLDGRNRALSGDVEALRRMLHESKEGTIPAAEMEQLSGLNSEQLLARCHAYAARAQMERTRCAEVLKRLKVHTSRLWYPCLLCYFQG